MNTVTVAAISVGFNTKEAVITINGLTSYLALTDLLLALLKGLQCNFVMQL